MKIGLLADIHGNAQALDAVLGKAKTLCVDRLLVAGDCVGYYFEPDKVFDLLSLWDCTYIAGNHEKMLARALTDSNYMSEIVKKYGDGLAIAATLLSSTRLHELISLPISRRLDIAGVAINLCHGSPWDENQYVYPDANEALLKKCAEGGADVVVMGHTHYPMMKTVGPSLLVNPGSVGQPRNRIFGAYWAVLEVPQKRVTFYREDYDVTPVISEARRRHPSLPYLYEVFAKK